MGAKVITHIWLNYFESQHSVQQICNWSAPLVSSIETKLTQGEPKGVQSIQFLI